MGKQRQLRCLIAAGGTVGHVAPSLAVAEALRARGVEVTFAGSPDRVEARLVPERGYAFDAFRVAGFPRRPGPQLVARARARRRGACRVPAHPRAATPRRRARRRRLRRGPDAARRVAAPDPGRADRGRRAPRPREPHSRRRSCARMFLAYPIDGLERQGAGRRPADPVALTLAPARRGAARARAPGGRAARARLRRQPGRAHAERDAQSPRGASAARTCCTSAASATTTSCAAA